MSERYNDFNKMLYLSKQKKNIEKKQAINERTKLKELEKSKPKINKWVDFRLRRAEALNRYLDVKKQ